VCGRPITRRSHVTHLTPPPRLAFDEKLGVGTRTDAVVVAIGIEPVKPPKRSVARGVEPAENRL
jgi:hypothetical protein